MYPPISDTLADSCQTARLSMDCCAKAGIQPCASDKAGPTVLRDERQQSDEQMTKLADGNGAQE